MPFYSTTRSNCVVFARSREDAEAALGAPAIDGSFDAEASRTARAEPGVVFSIGKTGLRRVGRAPFHPLS